jgi:hypothetical protein
MNANAQHGESTMSLIKIAIVMAASFTLLPSGAAAQGGWRQWDVYLRDGTHVVANPLGAPDSVRISTSMGSDAIDRDLIDYLAARTAKLAEPLRSIALPPAPTTRCRRDVVVRLDGRRSYGRVTFADIRFSEGTIVQNGVEMDLTEVAYIQFARVR